MRLLNTDDVRVLEESARNQGFDNEAMMEFVALQMAERLSRKIAHQNFSGELVALVGPGNNGADALVLLRQLFSKHSESFRKLRSVRIYIWQSKTQSELQKYQLEKLKKLPSKITYYIFNEENIENMSSIDGSFLLLDGFFGSSYEERVLKVSEKNALQKLAYLVSNKNPQIFAVDIVSGLQENGNLTPSFSFLKANESWTVAAPRFCQLQKDGVDASGLIKIVKLPGRELPIRNKEDFECCSLRRNFKDIANTHSLRFKALPRSSHKNQRGRVLVLGGDLRSGGAALLSAKAAFHAGAGYVTLLSKGNFPLSETNLGEWVISARPKNLAGWKHVLSDHEVLVFGCGMKAGGEPLKGLKSFFKALMAAELKTIVVDGGGLATWMRAEKAGWIKLPAETAIIFTPHPKEALDMLHALGKIRLKLTTRERFELFSKLHFELQSIYQSNFSVLLKGAYPLFGSATERFVWNIADSRLATAGMGDVLSGYIGSLSLRFEGSVADLGNGILDLSMWLQRLSLKQSLVGFLASEFSLAMRAAMNRKFYGIF